MHLIQKLLFSSVVLFGSSLVFAGQAFAKVDIQLQDNTEQKTISVIVNSNDSYIDGIDMSIMYSNNVTVGEIISSETYCKMGSTNEVFADYISLLCFNDSDTVVNGVIATIPYTTESQDYYFYVDTDTLDIAGLPVGEITDINKPEITEEETSETAETTDETQSTLDKITNFLTENSLYVLAGVITLIAIIIGIVGFFFKEKE